MKYLTALAAIAALTAAASASFAQSANPYDIRYSEKPVRVDGKLDDPAWADATALPLARTDGAAVQGGAVARLAWDNTRLYLALEIPDEIIVADRSDRDAPLWEKDDVVELFVWPREDQPYYYEIAVNPRNTVFDSFFVANAAHTGADVSVRDWNPDIQSLTRLQPVVYRPNKVGPPSVGGSWTVEMSIPLAAFSNLVPGPPAAGDVWRIQIVRFNRPDPGPGQLDATSLSPYAPITEPFRLDSFAGIRFQGGPAAVVPPLVPKSPLQASNVASPSAPPAAAPVEAAPAPEVATPAAPPVSVAPSADTAPPVPTPPVPVSPAQAAPVQPQPVTLNFHNMRAGAALDLLFQGTGLTYALSPDARPVISSSTVSADLKNAPFETALSTLLGQINLGYQKQGTMYVITPKAASGA
jgi:hypothetical protein